MKKRTMIVTASALALALTAVLGTSVLAASSADYIGEEKAKNIAFENAGLTASDVSYVWSRLDYDDGRAEYDVEFLYGTNEFDYEIDALTGTILSIDLDAEYYNSSISQNGVKGTTDASSTQTNGEYISAEEAKQLALEHAGLSASDVKYFESDFDYDHGRAVYELEWRCGWKEYSYDIDASDGAILRFESEYDD